MIEMEEHNNSDIGVMSISGGDQSATNTGGHIWRPSEPPCCPYDDTLLEEEIRPYFYKFYLGRFKFLVCPICKRVFHPEETSLAIEKLAKEKGIFTFGEGG